MDQITVSRELLRQVLDAIERPRETAMHHTLVARIPESGLFGGIAQDLDWAATELRNALKQPAVEPVAYIHMPKYALDGKVRPVVSFERYEDDYAAGIYSERIPLFTAPQAQQPVAKVIWPSVSGLPSIEWLVDTSSVSAGMALYAAPQAQQPRYKPTENEGSEP